MSKHTSRYICAFFYIYIYIHIYLYLYIYMYVSSTGPKNYELTTPSLADAELVLSRDEAASKVLVRALHGLARPRHSTAGF